MERLGGFPDGLLLGSIFTIAIFFFMKLYFAITEKPEVDTQKFPEDLELYYIPWSENRARKVTIIQYNGWKKYLVRSHGEILEVSEGCLREIKELDVKA